jgi:hypothetical protein
VVGVEDLGEKDPEGDERREEAVAEGDGFVANGLFSQVSGEEFGEGQSGSVGDLATQLSDLARGACGGSMTHGWSPCGERS